MTARAATSEPPRLFAIDGDARERTLEEVVLGVLAEPLRSTCVVCDGALGVISGGVRCTACGSELRIGVEPTVAWAA